MKKISILVLLVAVISVFGFASFQNDDPKNASEQTAVNTGAEKSGLTESNKDSW